MSNQRRAWLLKIGAEGRNPKILPRLYQAGQNDHYRVILSVSFGENRNNKRFARLHGFVSQHCDTVHSHNI